MIAQFLKFGVVGVVGFLIDTATVYATRGLVGIYAAGVLAYLVAASVNWVLNRVWTFRGRGRPGARREQWVLFMLANSAGFVLNRGAFALLVAFVPLCAREPVLAVAAGAIAGMLVNFSMNRAIVFPPAV